MRLTTSRWYFRHSSDFSLFRLVWPNLREFVDESCQSSIYHSFLPSSCQTSPFVAGLHGSLKSRHLPASSCMFTIMMLESAVGTFHTILPDSPSNDDEKPHLQHSISCYEHAILSTQLPRLLYSPPVNFGMVTHGLYRSSFPKTENFAYLRRLGLKSVLYDPSLTDQMDWSIELWYKKNIRQRLLHFLNLLGFSSFNFQFQEIKSPL